MCKKITCETCQKPTWEGCGEHIEYALKGVPLDERCACPRSTLNKPNDSSQANDANTQKGLLDRILGR